MSARSPQRWYFPYPLMLTIALLVVVGLAVAHVWYISDYLQSLQAAHRALPESTIQSARAMQWMVLGLVAFVTGAVWRRLRWRLCLEAQGVVIERLFPWRRPRKQTIDYERIRGVLISQTPRLDWQLRIEHDMGSEALPLMHARPIDEKAPKLGRLKDADSARAHPLVVAFSERLGAERIKVRARR